MLDDCSRDKLIAQLNKRLSKRWPRASWWVEYFKFRNLVCYYNNYGFLGIVNLQEVEPSGIKPLIYKCVRIPMRYRRRIGNVDHHYEPIDTTVIMNSKHFNECRREYGEMVAPLVMAKWMRTMSVDINGRCVKCKLGYVSNYANTDYYECYKCVLCGNSYTAN